ncbi:glycoside hydrolase domain-containing protein [Alicyclobacillus suci]|uniref:glycoside hydrolase domain-containing protein n=1 Tax=Alicyclobacillus suci TaxID=2816080 RepID=UPI001A8C2E46|nr:glycoside hydrolase domain-containing protein [Alicyclobacillus suci]
MAYNTIKLTDQQLARIRQRAASARVLAPASNQGADLSQWCGSVFDQGQEGACADCTTRDFLLWLQNKYGYSPVIDPSVNANYYFARLMYGDLNTDGGSSLHDAFQAAVTYGVIPSSDFAFGPNTLYVEPPLQDVAFQASSLEDLPISTEAIRASLDSGVPVGISILVMQTLYSPTMYDGMHIVDAGTVEPNQGHGVFVVAYKPDPTYGYLYRFQNSWGTSYGDNGFAWFTEAYLKQCLVEACTLDIPKTRTAPVPPNIVLQVGADKPSYTVGDSVSVWVTLENHGQTIIGQYVDIAISDGNDGSIPMLADGKNGFSWAPAAAGTYTLTATWGNLKATAQVTVSAAQPTPQPNPAPAPSPTPQPTPSPSPAPQGGSQLLHLDCSTRLTAANVQALKSAGYKVIGRYLGAKTTSMTKTITPDELKTIQSAGLSVILFWETNPTSAAYFTAAQGSADAKQAMEEMQYLGAPKTAAIYFVVDYDAQSSDMAAIEAYFKAVYQTVNGAYLVGAYGSYAVVSALWKTGYVDKVMQTYAWSAGQVSNCHVYQYQNNVTVAGVNADLNAVFAAPGSWPEVTPQVPNLSANPTVQSGSTGAAVQALQIALMRLGYSVVGTADGDFGPNTLSGVKAFQTAQKLTVDGIVGPATWAALDKAVGALKPPTPVPTPAPATVTATPIHAQVNGKDVQAYAIDDKTYVLWSAIPGVQDQKLSDGGWNFVTNSVDEKPVSLTLSYPDGSTQTIKL